MSAALSAQSKWVEEVPDEEYFAFSPTPLTRSMHLYAMHRLVSTFPIGSLSKEARAAHDEYMRWTDEHVPPVTKFKAVPSTSLHDESDPRNVVMKYAGRRIPGERTLELAQYPYAFPAGERFCTYVGAPYSTDRAYTCGPL